MDEEVADFVSLIQKEVGVKWYIGIRAKKDGSRSLQVSETHGSSCAKLSQKEDGSFQYELYSLGVGTCEVFAKDVVMESLCCTIRLNP
ncbi:hypothetical protein A9K97_gp451 [Tokyovirus A1]|uniref:hypothetical protein n=1 Tax=Tokyovirus A1 TaxID=1826170 RepID=UPI0007A96F3B|nr:hypothetical protein A9K97_gp451 [Tokyovirus A1]BAU79900.1 hypothetical protein [Tokyovirus A1]